MQCFSSKAPGRTLLLALDRGELLLESVTEAVRREAIETAVITGGLGSLSFLHLHTITTSGLPPEDRYLEIEGPIELGAVQGSVLGGVPHIHVIAQDFVTGQNYVGHLESGSHVAYRAEISIQEIPGAGVESYVDEATGLVRLRPGPLAVSA